MLYRIETDLSEKDMVDLLDRKRMVDKSEWYKELKLCSREDQVSHRELKSYLIDEIENNWLGCNLGEILITLQYEVYIADNKIELCFIEYSTYVEGFIRDVKYDVSDWDKSIDRIVKDWEYELRGLIVSVEREV